jgi:hypothetical protein
MNMISTIAAALLAAQAPAPPAVDTPLIDGTIAQLGRVLPEPAAARFRRVYLIGMPARGGGTARAVCGQVDMDDPRGEPGWVVFAGAMVNGRVMVLVGNRGIGSAASFCSGESIAWERDLDLSPRFEATLAR